MRVAFIVNQFPCLSETFILRQITGLLDRGHEVDIFAYSSGYDFVRHGDVEKYRLLSRTHYLTECACSQAGPVRALKRLCLIVTNFHKNPRVLLRTLNPARFGKRALLLQVLCQVCPFFGKGPYDIVHCQFGNLGDLGLLLKDTGVFHGKLVTSFRGYDASSYVKANGDHVYDDLFKRGDLFLCVSNHIRKRLIRLGCDEQKIIVHRSGVATKRTQGVRRVVTGGGEANILTVARLTEKKGVEYGIRAVARVLSKHPQIEYKIAGDGPLRGRLQELIQNLGVADQIRLVGWKTVEEISKLLETADILLAPSVTTEQGDEEGIPGVVMEACAHGLSVVSTHHAGISEIVQNRESGFLVAERDVDALAASLLTLVDDRELRVAMGKRGRALIETQCDIEILNDRLSRIYEKLCRANHLSFSQSRQQLYGTSD